MNARFFIKTFGCQMNKNDSMILGRILEDHGFLAAPSQDMANIYIINTCTVRAHAENRALAYIAGFKGWKQAPGRVLAVVGCLAKDKADEIMKTMSFVDLILGPDSYRRIGEYLSQVINTGTKIIDTRLEQETYSGIYPTSSEVSGFVSITRGCSNYCSYCIVPYVRGAVRSRPAEDICNEIAYLVSEGVKEITLLGQNVNEYIHEDVDFASLLEKAAVIRGMFRLRFLTSHPKDFDRRILQVIKTRSNVCEWFHLPLQSGNDRILELMNRKYTKEDYCALISQIRREIRDAVITTDIIVGFPTETAREYEDTISLVKEMRFDYAYMYRYSARHKTKASQLESLDENEIKRRLNKLIEIQSTITREKAEHMKGKTYEIMIEGPARHGASRGKTRGNKDVVVEESIEPGRIMNVVIKDVKGLTPIGARVDRDA
jgi:tRNA-2-methylthio-N6-dimethylallyladenosine synthase